MKRFILCTAYLFLLPALASLAPVEASGEGELTASGSLSAGNFRSPVLADPSEGCQVRKAYGNLELALPGEATHLRTETPGALPSLIAPEFVYGGGVTLAALPLERNFADCSEKNTPDPGPILFPEPELYAGFQFCKEGGCGLLLGWVEDPSGQTGKGEGSPEAALSGMHLRWSDPLPGTILFSPLHFPDLATLSPLLPSPGSEESYMIRAAKARIWQRRFEAFQRSRPSTAHRISWGGESGPLSLSAWYDLQFLPTDDDESSRMEFASLQSGLRLDFSNHWHFAGRLRFSHARGRVPTDTPSFDREGELILGSALSGFAEIGWKEFRSGVSFFLPESASRSGTIAVLEKERSGFQAALEPAPVSDLLGGVLFFRPLPTVSTPARLEAGETETASIAEHSTLLRIHGAWEASLYSGEAWILLARPLAIRKNPDSIPVNSIKPDPSLPTWIEAGFTLRIHFETGLFELGYARLHGKQKGDPYTGRFAGESMTIGFSARVIKW